MNFEGFLGNEALKERLSNALDKGQLSHCYLLAGPAGSGKHTLAAILTAAMQCTDPGRNKPCGQCPQCKKVFHGTHPDLITVDDPEKKIVPVKLVRDACADLFVRPNEGRKKVYLFPRAQDLNLQGQNTLLKCTEEPPPYGVFILLTEYAERLLPTIRSRCAELRLSPLPRQTLLSELRVRFPQASSELLHAAVERSGGYLGQAAELVRENGALLPQTQRFADAFASAERSAVLQVLIPMERLKREQLRPILLQWHTLVAAALAYKEGAAPLSEECVKIASVRSAASLFSAADAIRQALTYLDANVSPAHICGALAVRLR